MLKVLAALTVTALIAAAPSLVVITSVLSHVARTLAAIN